MMEKTAEMMTMMEYAFTCEQDPAQCPDFDLYQFEYNLTQVEYELEEMYDNYNDDLDDPTSNLADEG
jgi:hypothetical protein